MVSISRSLHIMSYSTLNGRDVVVALALDDDNADGGDSVFKYSHEAYVVPDDVDDDADADEDADGFAMNDTSTGGGGGLAENFGLGL